MTEVQLQYCKKCLNRKSGTITQENNCNLKGINLEFEGVCSSFDLDEKVIIGSEIRVEDIRPNESRARLAQTFVWIIMILDIVSVYSSYLQYNLLIGFQNNEEITDSMLTSNDLREQLLAIVYLIVFITSGIFFIKWFQRAYYNLSRITNCKHTDGWAAWSWFVPILNLFRPYQIMKELNEKTVSFLRSKTTDIIEDNTSLIGYWWGLWIASNYIGNYILKTSFKEDSVENLMNSTIADIVLSLIGIPLAIVTVKLIKSYALKEEKISEIGRKN